MRPASMAGSRNVIGRLGGRATIGSWHRATGSCGRATIGSPDRPLVVVGHRWAGGMRSRPPGFGAGHARPRGRGGAARGGSPQSVLAPAQVGGEVSQPVAVGAEHEVVRGGSPQRGGDVLALGGGRGREPAPYAAAARVHLEL